MLRNIDMQTFLNGAFEKYVVQRYARGINGTMRIACDDGSWVIGFQNSRPNSCAFTEGKPDADIQLGATNEQWDKILAVTPPPFYNGIYIASSHHGIEYTRNVTTLQYTPLVEELIRQLRGFVNGIPAFTDVPDPAPVTSTDRTDAITCHYVYIVVQGVEYRVFYEESGQGIPFLLQHTAGANSQEYRYLMNDPDFTKDFRFIAYDLPYHGKSLPPENYPWWNHRYTLTLDFMLAFQDAFIKALHLERPAYMGCSMGGHLAGDLAYYRPEQYRACVGIGCSLSTAQSGLGQKSLDGLGFAYDNPQVNMLYIGTTNEAIVALPPHSTPNSFREVGWDYANAYPGVFGGDIYYYMLDHDLNGKAQDIDTSKCMLYLLTGTYDPGTPPKTTQALVDQVKGSKLQFMEGVGHYAMLEAYPEFKKYFKPFADEIKTLK